MDARDWGHTIVSLYKVASTAGQKGRRTSDFPNDTSV